MRTPEPALAVTLLLSAGLAVAQQTAPPATTTPSTPAPTTTPSRTTTPSQTTPYPTNPNQLGPRPIFISGRVVMSDGLPLPERVKIERVCNGNTRIEAYTDRKGQFNFEIGRSLEMQDASISGRADPLSSGLSGFSNSGSSGLGSGVTEQSLLGCDLQGSLPGFRSDLISLANTHYMDNPEVGTIILHRIGNTEGLTVSATSALASKDAKKAYEKALAAIAKNNPDEAQVNLEKAVALYPRYAAAWYELGRVNEQRDHFEEARKAFGQALAADSKFLPPYERLSALALKDSKWEELADATSRLLQLDPLDHPDTYYLNSVANLQLQRLDPAETSAREAIRLDKAKKNTRALYVLGLVLARKRQFAASAESLKTFLDSNPSGTDLDLVRRQLSQVEQAVREESSQPLQ